jgi:hypothetical protein
VRRRAGWIDLPEGWVREGHSGPWPCVTTARFRRPDGSVQHWTSRSHRKRAPAGSSGSTWWAPRARGWWIAALNMVGSIAFGVSAIAAYVVPRSGELLSSALANLGTFVGALCFLSGAVLLLPERVAGPATADD